MPSMRRFQQFLFSLVRKLTCLSGQISIASDATVSSNTIQGAASVARTGTGEYTITLSDGYVALLACNLTAQAATAVDLVPQIKSNDVVSAKTVVFRMLAGATATDPSAACVVHVRLLMRDSSVLY